VHLYKFKSDTSLNHIEDIIKSNKFYLSSFDQLNDPMEGYFSYSMNEISIRELDIFKKNKQDLRVCSLAYNYHNYLMWSHYANMHKGLCFEVEINKNDKTLLKVNYSKQVPKLKKTNGQFNIPPEKVLSSKFINWRYENEYRFVSQESNKDIGRIKSIIFGIKSLITFRDKIFSICRENNRKIKFYRAKMGFNNNKIIREPINVYNNIDNITAIYRM
jgi:hypothetical protein